MRESGSRALYFILFFRNSIVRERVFAQHQLSCFTWLCITHWTQQVLLAEVKASAAEQAARDVQTIQVLPYLPITHDSRCACPLD